MKDMPELKDCPFCLDTKMYMGFNWQDAYIKCPKCTFKITKTLRNDEALISLLSVWMNTRAATAAKSCDNSMPCTSCEKLVKALQAISKSSPLQLLTIPPQDYAKYTADVALAEHRNTENKS